MFRISNALKHAFNWQVPSYLFIISVFALLCFIFYQKKSETKMFNEQKALTPQLANGLSSIKYLREEDYNFTKPLLMTESTETPTSMILVKEQISEEINFDINSGNISNASVFLRRINEAGAVAVNCDNKYNPGSMMKIPVMITCLKAAMKDRVLLDKKIKFEAHNNTLALEEGAVAVLKEGNYYTIRELIEHMIIESDNESMGLLYNLLGQEELNKVFIDLGINIPASTAHSFDMSPIEFSRLMLILYNSTYLDSKYSEWALSTLCKAKYNKGLTRNLPSNISVAHKYGVAFSGSTKMLSESAIVYCNKEPYLLVIMTKGYDYSKQSDVINKISDIVYHSMVN